MNKQVGDEIKLKIYRETVNRVAQDVILRDSLNRAFGIFLSIVIGGTILAFLNVYIGIAITAIALINFIIEVIAINRRTQNEIETTAQHNQKENTEKTENEILSG